MAVMEQNGSATLDGILKLFDDIESRIESFRKTCQSLETERSSLLETLETVSSQNDNDGLSAVDQEELAVTSQRLRKRLETVHISVTVQRDEQQTEALDKLNSMLDKLITEVQNEDASQVMATVNLYHVACSEGGTGSKFESLLVSCTSDDQKDVKSRVIQMYEQVSAVLS